LKTIVFFRSVFFLLHSENLFFSSFSVFFRRWFSSGLPGADAVLYRRGL